MEKSSDNPDDWDSVSAGIVLEQVPRLGQVVQLLRVGLLQVLCFLEVLLPGSLQ